MLSEPIFLSPEEKLEILRSLDIFHPWESLDETRICGRCGQVFAGHDIKVFGAARTEGGMRLECPTEGCLSVPIEWILMESSDETPSGQAQESPHPLVEPLEEPDRSQQAARPRPGLFGFVRVTAGFI